MKFGASLLAAAFVGSGIGAADDSASAPLAGSRANGNTTVAQSQSGETKTGPSKSPGGTLSSETNGQVQPQGHTGPLTTTSEGITPESPQGDTPPGMQANPGGRSKTKAEPNK